MRLSPLSNSYTKAIYSGCGNRFIVTNEPALPSNIPRLCELNGTDGLILIEPSAVADFKMRIFNADASEVEMCGNGLRCAVKFMSQSNPKEQYTVETLYATCQILVEEENLSVRFPLPDSPQKIIIADLEGYFLNTGVPHAVFFVDDFSQFEQAAAIRHHPQFSPQGTNVNFAIKKGGEIQMRTYERGVEGETGACGTGAVAVAFCSGLDYPIKLTPSSGIPLLVNKLENALWLSGPAVHVGRCLTDY